MLLIFWSFKQVVKSFYTKSTDKGPHSSFLPYPSLLSYAAAADLKTGVIYLSSSVCLTVLLVKLIYGLVAHVMNTMHITAELKKTEQMNVIGEL